MKMGDVLFDIFFFGLPTCILFGQFYIATARDRKRLLCLSGAAVVGSMIPFGPFGLFFGYPGVVVAITLYRLAEATILKRSR